MSANQTIQTTSERTIGTGQPPFVISEIVNNYNGDMGNARKLTDQSIADDVEAAEFQTKEVNTVFSKELLDSSYTGGNSKERKHVLELSEEEYGELKDYLTSMGVIFFSTMNKKPGLLGNLHLPSQIFGRLRYGLIAPKTALGYSAVSGEINSWYTFQESI